jgi:hypothetical protein
VSYASHTNNDVHHQMLAGQEPTKLPLLLGQFVEADYGHTFEYAERRWPDAGFETGFPHIVYVGNGQTRLAKVMRTVVHVVTGEGEIQKWKIKQHREYPTDWVRVVAA